MRGNSFSDRQFDAIGGCDCCHHVCKCTSQIDKAILREVAVAKELIAAKRKERALLALKKKKLHEQQLDRVDAFLLNIEQVQATPGF
jgi:hypothetical protein